MKHQGQTTSDTTSISRAEPDTGAFMGRSPFAVTYALDERSAKSQAAGLLFERRSRNAALTSGLIPSASSASRIAI